MISDHQESDGTGQTSLELLERMVHRVREREPDNYFVGILDLYTRYQRLSTRQVAAFLGVETGRAWARLALCGRPRGQRLVFWSDMREIAAETGANLDRLVPLVRTVDTLQAIQGLSLAMDVAGDAGLLAAARDRTGIIDSNEALVSITDTRQRDDEMTRTLPLWLDTGTQLAVTRFWEAAGTSEPEPSHLERDALRSLPCIIIYLPRLALSRIETWLDERDIPYRFPCPNRFLRGCLLAYRGCGLIFIDSEDTPAEQQYTLAHELVHFMVDYLQRRDEAIDRLGPEVADILDGRRDATLREQVEAGFEEVSLQSYFHLLDRAGSTTHGAAVRTTRTRMSDPVVAAENVADRVALELLAPSQVVMARLTELGIHDLGNEPARFITETHAILQDEYRLPREPALVYAATLVDAFKTPTVENWLADL